MDKIVRGTPDRMYNPEYARPGSMLPNKGAHGLASGGGLQSTGGLMYKGAGNGVQEFGRLSSRVKEDYEGR
jgi:hypothetical protein